MLNKFDKVVKTITVYKTMDYGKDGDLENLGAFKLLPENRNIDIRHARYLANKMEREGNKLDKHPIEVTKDGEILDGQHRLIGARSKGYEICYYVSDGDIDDVVSRNTGNKNWTWIDFMDHWAKRGNQSYEYLKELHETYPTIQKKILLLFCGVVGHRGGLSHDVLASGEAFVAYEQYKAAEKYLKMLQDFIDITGLRVTTFNRAVYKLVRSPKYNHQEMMIKLVETGDFSRCYTEEDYLVALEDVQKS